MLKQLIFQKWWTTTFLLQDKLKLCIMWIIGKGWKWCYSQTQNPHFSLCQTSHHNITMVDNFSLSDFEQNPCSLMCLKLLREVLIAANLEDIQRALTPLWILWGHYSKLVPDSPWWTNSPAKLQDFQTICKSQHNLNKQDLNFLFKITNRCKADKFIFKNICTLDHW